MDARTIYFAMGIICSQIFIAALLVDIEPSWARAILEGIMATVWLFYAINIHRELKQQ